MHQYRNASYGGESVTLDNGLIRLDMHKRICGWGWGEIYTPEGKFMAVIDHLGEMLARDQEIPMRMEADTYTREDTDTEMSLIFDVKACVVQDKLKNTSFDCWIHYAFGESCMRGQVKITMPKDQPAIRMSMRFQSNINGYASYIRGPWLKVGQDSFGIDKDDSMLPGVEWNLEKEWSSGTDYFKDPWALRVCPQPQKVTAPVMILSQGGDTIRMSYDPKAMATGWFNNARHVQQPVFAVPNFIDRQNNNIFGLMVPAAIDDNHENQPRAVHPVELHLDQMVNFDCEIVIGKGLSLDALTDYVKKTGLPAPSYTREELTAQLHRYAHLYNTLYWWEGQGFGVPQSRPGQPFAYPGYPAGLKKYVEMFPDAPDTAGLKEKMAWCDSVSKETKPAKPVVYLGVYNNYMPKTKEEALALGLEIVSWQKEDGSFPYDPDGIHYVKDDFPTARALVEPLGLIGDSTTLEITIAPTMALLQLAHTFGLEQFYAPAIKGLDYCAALYRSEGADNPETPLHAPNLLSAGHAANIFYTAYRILGEEKYLKTAIHWIRCLLVFTHMWEPAKIPMLYNTKPCLCCSDWYFANWVRDHVQWEVLNTFEQAARLGIDWGKIDTEIDWNRFQEGVTSAGVRWTINAHKDGNWLPHNLPFTYAEYVKGSFDGCYPDTHNAVTGYYGGAMIMPSHLVDNLVDILGRQ